MALVQPQAVVRAGTAPNYVAAAVGGDQVPAGATTVVSIKNGSAAAITATFVTPGKVEGQDIADLPVVVPAGGERLVGPLSDLFRDASNLVNITWSAAAGVTFAVLSV